VIRKLAAIGVFMALLVGLSSACSGQPQKPRSFLEIRPYDGSEPSLLVDYASAEESLLFGPHFGLVADWTATFESLSAEDAKRLGFTASPEGFRSADGHEFVVMQLGSTQFEKGRWSGHADHSGLTAHLSIGDRRKDLDNVPGPGTLIVASVPTSAPVKLTVTDEGRNFSLDLRTAEPDPHGYRIASQTVNESYEESGVVNTPFGSVNLGVDITIAQVSHEPYIPGLGWARKGRRWLRLSLSQASSTGVQGTPAVGFFLDAKKTFALKVGGKKVRPRGRLINTAVPIATAPYSVIFDVPESFSSGELAVTPDGPMFTYRGESWLTDYTDIAEPPTCGESVVCLKWQKHPKRQSEEVTLS
jgi:hypothetical protein